MQKLLEETQLDMNEFDNLLQPIIDTCTKDAISVSVDSPSACYSPMGWPACSPACPAGREELDVQQCQVPTTL